MNSKPTISKIYLVVAAVVGVFAFAAVSGAFPSSTSSATTPSCVGSSLKGVFAVIPGSAGAGSISYVLRLRNKSQATCMLTGLPRVQLLGQRHQPLPTYVTAAHPQLLTAVIVVMNPGSYASASARFSPDIPGPGEPVSGLCEPKAYFARVRPRGGGTLLVYVQPPTSVCEHGSMRFTAFVAGKKPPI